VFEGVSVYPDHIQTPENGMSIQRRVRRFTGSRNTSNWSREVWDDGYDGQNDGDMTQ